MRSRFLKSSDWASSSMNRADLLQNRFGEVLGLRSRRHILRNLMQNVTFFASDDSTSRLGFYNNVGLSAYYSCSGIDDLTHETVRSSVFSAVAKTIQQHPALSSIPVDRTSSQPWFARITEIDLERVVSFVHRKVNYLSGTRDVELEGLIQSQHNLPFRNEDPPIPFWRLIVLMSPPTQHFRSFAAVFMFHHAIADTGSAVKFHQSFAAALSQDDNDCREEKFTIKSPITEMLPPLETLYQIPISQSLVAQLTGLSVRPAVPEELWSGHRPREPLDTRIRLLILTAEQSTNFAASCRGNKASVTAALETILAATLFGLIPETFSLLRCDCAVDLRRWIPSTIVGKDSMGSWAGSISDTFSRQSLGGGFTWNEARRASAAITDALSSGGTDFSCGTWRYVKNIKEFLLSMMNGKRGTSFELSNLGRLRVDENTDGTEMGGKRRKWNLDTVVFSQSAAVVGGAIKVSVVTGADGRLTMVFTWQDGIVEDGLMGSLIERVHDLIVAVAHRGN